MKKTFVAGALAFTMAAAFLSGCGSNTQTKAANRLEEIQQRGYIEVATEPYFAPNEFIDSSKSGWCGVEDRSIGVCGSIKQCDRRKI